MLYKALGNLQGMALAARDGEIGRVEDVYFDDAEWTCRYLVVETGGWLSGRYVLIAPHSLRRVDFVQSNIEVDLSREQVQRSPDIHTDKPISRQQESEYYDYYGMPYYWAGPYVWGPTRTFGRPDTPAWDAAMEARLEQRARERERYDPHLRSADEVKGYEIRARDGAIGKVEDLLLDEDDWRLRYLVVDTRKWLPGKHVLVAVDWVEQVSWAERAVSVDMSKESVRNSPEYDSDVPLVPQDEANLYAHYGRERPNVRGLR